MNIDEPTPEAILQRLELLCARMIDTQDYASSIIAEKLKKDLQRYFEKGIK